MADKTFDIDKFIDTAFRYHAPNENQIKKFEEIRTAAREFARLIAKHTAQSGEQMLALRELETAVMWANAAIAFHG